MTIIIIIIVHYISFNLKIDNNYNKNYFYKGIKRIFKKSGSKKSIMIIMKKKFIDLKLNN